jgi:hypothetical protein
MNRFAWLALLAAAATLTLADRPLTAAPELRVGASAVKITPSLTRPVYIAGYDNNRVAEGVHDDLWARALVLDDGTTRMAVVALDLIGVSNLRVQKMRAGITSVPADNVLVACTHVHSGPDTLGIWGPSFATTGIDPLYMDRLQARVKAAVDQAVQNLQPARMLAGKTTVPDGLVYNSREPIQDKQLTALRFVGRDGGTIATVVNYGGHPEINKSKQMTADFVGPVREAVEKRFGGTAIFLNGALGGMVTPKISGHTWEEIQRVGQGVGASAVEAGEKAEPVEGTRLEITRRKVELPLANDGFKLYLGSKVLEGELKDNKLTTEVWRVNLGRQVTWVSIPGEILPKPALDLKSRIPGKYRMVIALGNDELGYILDPEDWPKDRFKYERTMSVGPETWPKLFEAAQDLLR